jgi:hypothetical protein
MRKPLTQADLNKLAKTLNPKTIKAAYNAALKPTGNPEVDAAFTQAHTPQPPNPR